MRGICLIMIAVLILGNSAAFAQESKLILEEEPRTDFTVYGWTFLLLSLGTFAYGASVYSDSQDDIDKADANFAGYESATTQEDATAYRTAANEDLNNARAKEGRANLALWLGIIFGLTSWYSFNAEDLPETGLALTGNSIILRHRF